MNVICPKCGSDDTIFRGYTENGTGRRLECRGDHSRFYDPRLDKDFRWFIIPVDQVEKPLSKKTLIFDIETGIRPAMLFGTGEQYVGAEAFAEEPIMLGWSAKYAGDSKIYSRFMTKEEVLNKDHSQVVKELWDMLSTVTISASYNGNNFDVRYVNSFFAQQDLGLPNKIRNIDPCQIARSVFRLDSYKMDYLAKYFRLDDGKHKMEKKDWLDYRNGVPEAMKKMKVYCEHDVEILELILDKVKPYYHSLPNMRIYGLIDKPICPACGSNNIFDNGEIQYGIGLYKSYRCECKALFRSRENLLNQRMSKQTRNQIATY